MNTTFNALSDDYPAIFKIRWNKPSELLAMFDNVVLRDVPASKVERELITYVTNIIEPVGWNAIWRTSLETFAYPFICDLEVEVIDVSRSSLTATVIFRRLLAPLDMETKYRNQIELSISNQEEINVPLVELYVVCENENDEFLQTALIIEQIRTFYTCIWRPWDDLFTAFDEKPFRTELEQRINLYIDIKQKSIQQSVINQIKYLLKEGWRLRKRLNTLIDSLDALRIKFKLTDIERAMKAYEDSEIRPIASSLFKHLLPNDDILPNCGLLEETCNNKFVHIISQSYTQSILKMINEYFEERNEDENILVFHCSLNGALGAVGENERILLMPGIYNCKTSIWVDNNIMIEGLTKNNQEVVLLASDEIGDVFFNISVSNAVTLANLTLRTVIEVDSIIVVHSGTLNLSNCLLDGSNAARNVVTTLTNAQVNIDNSVILNTKQSSNNNILNGNSGGDEITAFIDEEKILNTE